MLSTCYLIFYSLTSQVHRKFTKSSSKLRSWGVFQFGEVILEKKKKKEDMIV